MIDWRGCLLNSQVKLCLRAFSACVFSDTVLRVDCPWGTNGPIATQVIALHHYPLPPSSLFP